ncbi:MAG TPA: hypothetical protein VET25_08035 [Aestuariivirgaceae bacterium]|nr:hypothetical protein [Aestuariivirgaceae bacterium]
MKTKKKTHSSSTGKFPVGRDAFDKISAIEGMNLTLAMKRTFKELDKQGLTPGTASQSTHRQPQRPGGYECSARNRSTL